ncbi:self-incompatibility protein 2 [Cucumis melo var. makuwa]|uniref:Self-incompatibility protein 2 n=1 Tax=Cucumis melo var. makuwa TaxID=1194695 RepID=A0A5A7V4A7_CUCMM|nr:self-incompatibility protein 2 [Cucumis melo var. makuwa]
MELLAQLQAVFSGDSRGGFNTSIQICESTTAEHWAGRRRRNTRLVGDDGTIRTLGKRRWKNQNSGQASAAWRPRKSGRPSAEKWEELSTVGGLASAEEWEIVVGRGGLASAEETNAWSGVGAGFASARQGKDRSTVDACRPRKNRKRRSNNWGLSANLGILKMKMKTRDFIENDENSLQKMEKLVLLPAPMELSRSPEFKVELYVGDSQEKFRLLGIQLDISRRGMCWVSKWHTSFKSHKVANEWGVTTTFVKRLKLLVT